MEDSRQENPVEEEEVEVEVPITNIEKGNPEPPDSGAPVVANVLGVAGGAAQLIIDGTPIRNLRNVETAHSPEGTIVTVQFSPDILIQELVTGEMLEQRLEEIAKMQQQRQFVDPQEGPVN